jgi:hypothetical protein
MLEEKQTLSDIDHTFKIFERDRDKHAKILNEDKLKQDELKRLKTEDNKIKKDYRIIVVTD